MEVDKQMIEKNSLNTIRLLTALQVMWGHMFFHLNVPDIGGASLHSIIRALLGFFSGVPVFFFLSGFLIWKSVNREKDTKQYFKKRFLRIYPELWIAVSLEIISLLIFYEKVNVMTLVVFAFTQGTVLQFWTPDALRGYGCGTPNGSLWTITIFVQFYILIWMFKKVLNGRKPVFWTIAEVILIAIGLLNPVIESHVSEIIYKLYCQTIVPYLWIFGLGIIVSEYWGSISAYLKRWWFIFVIAYVAYCLLNFDIFAGTYPVIRVFLTALGCLGLAFKFPQINIKYDISYEAYILHMIIVNILYTKGVKESTGMVTALALSAIASIALYWVNRTFIVRMSKKKVA